MNYKESVNALIGFTRDQFKVEPREIFINSAQVAATLTYEPAEALALFTHMVMRMAELETKKGRPILGAELVLDVSDDTCDYFTALVSEVRRLGESYDIAADKLWQKVCRAAEQQGPQAPYVLFGHGLYYLVEMIENG